MTTPIVSKDIYYGVDTLDMMVSNVSLGLPKSVYKEGGPSLVDSGTFSLVVPDVVYAKINQMINASCPASNLVGVCNVPFASSLFNGICFDMNAAQINAFPQIQIVLTGVTLTINGNNYLVQNILEPAQYCYGIQNGGPDSLLIHGDVVLKYLYTVIDNVHNTIGFAPANIAAC